MKIAICDDVYNERQQLYQLLQKYSAERKLAISLEAYSSGSELLDAFRGGGAGADLLFLDILMPGLTDIETARELREYDKRAILIFLTASPNYALDAFSVRARHYLIKPCSEEALFPLMDELVAELTRVNSETIIINTKTGLRSIRVDMLEYCEIQNHTVCYHMANGMAYMENGNMGELENRLLAYPYFIRPHRSYLVNIRYILRLDGKTLEMEFASSVRLPIPKARYSEIREAFLNWSGRKKSDREK